jgi:hypothetical protein
MVQVVVYDLLGHPIAELMNGELAAGYYETWWSPESVSTGVYLLRVSFKSLETGKQHVQVRRIMLLK